jgi:type IX secretion system PorP/SprF family membrane protein
MKRYSAFHIVILLLTLLAGSDAMAQSMHFSQYYNAPMLLNPANTALMPDNDYRIGANYRSQWASIPVPYNTFSAFADFKVAGSRQDISNSWLGLGLALFNDKAGDGNLALTEFQGFAAYHVQLSSTSMLSGGLSGGYVQRSVNYDDLTFDAQWDGFTFNKSLPNSERNGVAKTDYFTVGAGLNYAYFPNENIYIKVGAALANINEPTESFYGMSNQVGLRPTGNIDALFRAGDTWIINPSVYYTTQLGAYELVYGSLFRTYVGSHEQGNTTQFIFGFFNRLDESVIGAVGFQWGGLQLMTSYDFTISTLAPATNGNGALEFSLIYMGNYGGSGHGGRRTYNCPSFF